MDSPSQQPQETTQGIWPAISAVLLVLVFVGLIAIVMMTRGFPSFRSPVASPLTFDYSSDLYLFSIQATYPQKLTLELVYQETCGGVVITQYPHEGGFELDAARKPWLYVWYHLPMPSYVPLDQYLMPFIEEAKQDCYLDCTQVGIPQMIAINQNQAAVVLIQGIDHKTQQEVKWYQAVVRYAGRVYAIRFVAPLGPEEEPWAWKQSWPVFEKLINGITFR
jgi:hypothetical protein